MNALITCVEYHDLLEVTLPYNRHHFDRTMVVTSCSDTKTQSLCQEFGVEFIATNIFYENGADFNKYAAVEKALDAFGRMGWMCIMDADILFPKVIPHFLKEQNTLYTPERRMCFSQNHIPDDWTTCGMDRNSTEWCGYAHIFHSSARWLPDGNWYETNWKHAGGADTAFQNLFPKEFKSRPPFECLHLGIPYQNWCGRSTPFADGTLPDGHAERADKLKRYIRGRMPIPRFSNQDRNPDEKIRNNASL